MKNIKCIIHNIVNKDILIDVCDKLKVEYDKNFEAIRIEELLVQKIFSDTIEKMEEKDYQEFMKELKKEGFNEIVENGKVVAKNLALPIFIAIFKAGGFKSYQLTLIIVNTIWKIIFKKGLSFVANHTLTKLMSILTGPAGWTISAILTAIEVSGPASRVTIPSVFYIIVARQKWRTKRRYGKY